MQRTLPSPRQLDAKLELLQELGYVDRFYLDREDTHTGNPLFVDHDSWVKSEYDWALREAAEHPPAGVPDLFDAEEDEEACLPCVYDPTFFSSPRSRSRSTSLSQIPRTGLDKPLPSLPPPHLRNRPSLPLVPPSSPVSTPSSPRNSPSISMNATRGDCHTPPPSPHSPRTRTYPRPSASPPVTRTLGQRHATFPSISSTLSLLEERESEAEKRSAVYLDDRDQPQPLPPSLHRAFGRGRSSSATIASDSASFSIGSSPRRKHRPTLPTLATSVSSPQLRRLAELAAIPSPSFSPASSPLLPSPMSDTTITPDDDVAPGEAITSPVVESPQGLASRWSLDSVASRPRITPPQMALADGPASPANNKSKKRGRLLSLISGRTRSGSVTKPLPPPNTPRASSDVVDSIYHRNDARDALDQLLVSSPTRSTFAMPSRMQQAPSLSSTDSSNASSASNLATPIEAVYPEFADPFAMGSPSCLPESEFIEEEAPVFAANPYIPPDSPLLPAEAAPAPPSPPHSAPLYLPGPLNVNTNFTADDEYYMGGIPGSPPPQPTLPLPSPGTPSPSFLVPTQRPQSFFAALTGRQRRRKKKLVISGGPLELAHGRASNYEHEDDMRHRRAERERRMRNVIRWCEDFGPLRKMETKEDGSLHVYWKDWEIADMVCRVQAQVIIKDVGRVSLAWSYIS